MARQICERLRLAIENYHWAGIDVGKDVVVVVALTTIPRNELKVTMSFGLAALSTEANVEGLLALADKRLYEAKQGGAKSGLRLGDTRPGIHGTRLSP